MGPCSHRRASNRLIGDPQPELEEEITRVALAHRLVSAYTSFVAVEEKIVTGSELPVLVEVPVEMPEGVSYEGVFGGEPKPMSLAYAGKAQEERAPCCLASLRRKTPPKRQR